MEAAGSPDLSSDVAAPTVYSLGRGRSGAALGLELEEAYRFVADRKLRLGVGGWCEGRARDLWKYQKLESIAEGKEITSDVLLREQWIDARLVFLVESPDDTTAEAVARALSRPSYPLTAGTSDALLKVVAVRVDCEPPRTTRRLAFSMVYGELPPRYKLAEELDRIPLNRIIHAPTVERLPTGFVFDPVDPRRLAGRDLVTFVSDPIELEDDVEAVTGFAVEPQSRMLLRESPAHQPLKEVRLVDHPRASLRLDPNAGGKLLDDALAKREDKEKGQEGQSYRGHVTAVYDAWCGLKEVHARADRSRIAARSRAGRPSGFSVRACSASRSTTSASCRETSRR